MRDKFDHRKPSGRSKKNFKKLEVKCFLSSENDFLDCYLEFHAGAGGTESQDWAEMLRRMYMKWAANRGHKVELISEHKADEAGIKSSTKVDQFSFITSSFLLSTNISNFSKGFEFLDHVR